MATQVMLPVQAASPTGVRRISLQLSPRSTPSNARRATTSGGPLVYSMATPVGTPSAAMRPSPVSSWSSSAFAAADLQMAAASPTSTLQATSRRTSLISQAAPQPVAAVSSVSVVGVRRHSAQEAYVIPEGERSVERCRPAPLSFHVDSTCPTPSPEPSEACSDGDLKDDFVGAERRTSWATYPASPTNVLPKTVKPKGIEPRIGIDIGGVLTRDGDPDAADLAKDWGEDWEAPGALDAVERIAEVFGPENVFLVSKVKPGGSMQRRTEQWLHETMRFCPNTGVPRENIVFTSDLQGPCGKGAAAARLGLSHFVDDKIAALSSVFHDEAGNSGHMIERFNGILFHFAKGGAGGPPDCDLSDVAPMMRRFYKTAASWQEVIEQLHQKLPGPLRQKGAALLAPKAPKPKTQREQEADEMAARAAKAPPPWMRNQQKGPASPTASRGQSAFPALQRSENVGERPKLALRPRTETPEQPADVMTQLRSPSGRPKLCLQKPTKAEEPPPSADSSMANFSTPALQACSPSGRPKLVLKPRSAAEESLPASAVLSTQESSAAQEPPAASFASTAGVGVIPAVEADLSAAAARALSPSGRPRLVLKPKSAPEKPSTNASSATGTTTGDNRAAAPPAPTIDTDVSAPAMQATNPGERPKLVLKSRDPKLGAKGQAADASKPEEPHKDCVSTSSNATAAPPAPTIDNNFSAPAMQATNPGERPKLVLKSRDPRLGTKEQAADANKSEEPHKGCDATSSNAPAAPPAPTIDTDFSAPAMQATNPGERPKLALKSRDPKVGAKVQAADANKPEEPPKACAATSSNLPVAAAAKPSVAKASNPNERPKLQLKSRDPTLGPVGQIADVYFADDSIEQAKTASSAPTAQPVEAPAAVTAPTAAAPAPALQPDPAGGRPKLQLKKRSEPSAPESVASAQPDATTHAKTSSAAAAAPAGPALQRDPAGGRPRLMLKPRGSADG